MPARVGGLCPVSLLLQRPSFEAKLSRDANLFNLGVVKPPGDLSTSTAPQQYMNYTSPSTGENEEHTNRYPNGCQERC